MQKKEGLHVKVLKILVALNLIAFLVVSQSQADEQAKAPNSIYQSWDSLGGAPTHKWITEDAVKLLIDNEGTRYVELRAFCQELKEGAIREDDGATIAIPYKRTKNHYYNPYTKKGIHASSIGWALGTEKDGDKVNNFTFLNALNEYEKARLSYTKWEGWNFYETYGAYRCIGNVLHLLQDMSVPWHTTDPLDNWSRESLHNKYETYLGQDNMHNNYDDNYKPFASLAKKVAKPDLFTRYKFDYQGAITEIFHDLALASHGKTYSKDRFSEIAKELVPKAVEYSAGLMKYFYDYVDAMGWTEMKDRDTHRYTFIRDVALGDTVKIYTIAGEQVTVKAVARNLDNGIISWDGLNSAGNVCAFGVYYYVINDIHGNKKRTGKIALMEEYNSPVVSQLSITQSGLGKKCKIYFHINEPTCLTVKVYDEKGTYAITSLFNQFKVGGIQEVEWIAPDKGNYILEISGFDVAGNNFSYKDYIKIGAESISGNAITDSNNKGIQGVEIEISQGNMIKRITTTSSNGSYIIPYLPDGKYTVKAKIDDMVQCQEGITVNSGKETSNINFIFPRYLYRTEEKKVSESSRSGKSHEFHFDSSDKNYKIYEWKHKVSEDKGSRDNGTYIDYNNNKLMIRVRLDGRWHKKAKYSANYTIYTRRDLEEGTKDKLAKIMSKVAETPLEPIKESYPIIFLGQDKINIESRKLAPDNENKIKIPIMIKDVEEELTTAKIKLSFDPNIVKIEDICAPLFENEGIIVHLQSRIDNQEGKIEIEAVISEEEDIINEKKATMSDNTLFAKTLEEDEEENIAPIAYLILELPQKVKSLSPQKSFDNFRDFLIIEDAELKDSGENIIKTRIKGKDIVKTNEYNATLDKVYCYPNPTTDQITFANLTNQIRVKIFNISGDLVYGEQEHISNGNGEWKWDCRNNNGEKVASGIYIYILQVPASDNIKKGKIAVVR